MRHGRGTRGMTLLEAVFSVLILTAGVVAVFGMLGRISSANRNMAFHTSALDAYAQLAAQIRDARCLYAARNPVYSAAAADTDPGLAAAMGNVWVSAPPAGSTITAVGDRPGVPLIRVDYRGTVDTVAAGAPVSMSLQVRVREVMRDATKDAVALETGYWIQIFPLEKTCAARPDATSRGEYP